MASAHPVVLPVTVTLLGPSQMHVTNSRDNVNAVSVESLDDSAISVSPDFGVNFIVFHLIFHFRDFPQCRTCQCNGHASICDQRTGACIDCRNLTDGPHCERCVDGYYGDPRLGVSIPCKPCPCPGQKKSKVLTVFYFSGGPGSGYQHADTCYIAPQNQTVICNCR